jgi:hypothetical protein
MARFRIVLEFEGPTAPRLPRPLRDLGDILPMRYYTAQLAGHLLKLDPDAFRHSPLTPTEVADAFPGARLAAATFADPDA